MLAILTMIALKTWFVTGQVVEQARGDAAEAAFIDKSRVEVRDGLDIHMTGFRSEAERDAAVAAVDPLDSSWDVTAALADGVVADPADDDTAGDDTADDDTAGDDTAGDDTADDDTADPAANIATSGLSLTVGADGAVLSGTVADATLQAELAAQATTAFGSADLTDELTLDPGLNVATGEQTGLVVEGEAISSEQQAEWIEHASAIAEVAGVDMVDRTTVASIEDTLNALFELEPIEFDTNRATIRTGSRATLDEAATVIIANPGVGRLLVVGHTDSDGRVGDNLDLSERRAAAVVDYLISTGGVDADRLEAEGRGESELKIDPELTANDKQRNRRIEWERIS